MTPETWGAALAAAARRLAEAGVEDSMRDARRLMAGAAAVPPERVTLILPETPDPEAATRFSAFVARRATREPVSRILAIRSFWGRDFRVTPEVLDPRPETETLVELALSEPFTRLLDLGTGSGCILVTLLAERPGTTALGTDLSPGALAVAAENARRLGVADRAEFRLSDWFGAVGGRFDLIVSNPPYIAADEMPGLAPEVRLHDPAAALTDGADGLSAYRAIASGAPGHLAPGGRLMVEIGPTQGDAVAGLFRAAGLDEVRIHPDLDGRARVVSARSPIR